jgi:hypothetical protein
MSIATLKKKTKAIRNLSNRKDVFSLNGTLYDNTVRAQRSVMNSKGLLSSRVYHPTRSTDTYNGSSGCSLNQGCRKWYVKTFDPLDHSQIEYIKQIKNYETGLSLVECAETPVIPCSEDNMYMLGTRKISRNTYVPQSPLTARSCGEYTDTELLPHKCLPTPPCKQSFPMKLQNGSCRKVYTDPQQAIADGLLPTNWMNC